jgi:hypothetical protein
MYNINNKFGYSGFGSSPNPMDISNFGSDKSAELSKMYAELELLKNSQPQVQRTVFTDIGTEMADATEDERIFIENSKEYISLNQQYQQDFSTFLIDKFGNEFSNSKYGKTPEKILAVIRNKREEYKNKFAENLNEIKQSNKDLITRNDELAKVNENLQKQLLEIQNKLGEFVS